MGRSSNSLSRAARLGMAIAGLSILSKKTSGQSQNFRYFLLGKDGDTLESLRAFIATAAFRPAFGQQRAPQQGQSGP